MSSSLHRRRGSAATRRDARQCSSGAARGLPRQNAHQLASLRSLFLRKHLRAAAAGQRQRNARRGQRRAVIQHAAACACAAGQRASQKLTPRRCVRCHAAAGSAAAGSASAAPHSTGRAPASDADSRRAASAARDAMWGAGRGAPRAGARAVTSAPARSRPGGATDAGVARNTLRTGRVLAAGAAARAVRMVVQQKNSIARAQQEPRPSAQRKKPSFGPCLPLLSPAGAARAASAAARQHER